MNAMFTGPSLQLNEHLTLTYTTHIIIHNLQVMLIEVDRVMFNMLNALPVRNNSNTVAYTNNN